MKTNFVAHYRVSTDKQGLQGNGIEAKKQSVARYLTSLDCQLLASFEEVESGANNKTAPEEASAGQKPVFEPAWKTTALSRLKGTCAI